ncbi:MAG: hypothetical protein RMJ59_00915 [Candidatus Nitrosocaldus sp.]|nr:hypothetical protein [Candidatus Nitrosocaldus sp.]
MRSRIRVALIGVGNVACTLLQGMEYYRKMGSNDGPARKGLWHERVGNYTIDDIDVVCAFDVDANKVGRSIHELLARDGSGIGAYRDLEVRAGMMMDRPPEHWHMDVVTSTVDEFTSALRQYNPDVVLNLISSSLDGSSLAYAESALRAGASFINATPSSLQSNHALASAFRGKNLLLVGDDLMSQFGGTVFHKGILQLLHRRGMTIGSSYQLDVGGSRDTRNTMVEEVRARKRSIKTASINAEVPYEFGMTAGTTEYVEFMGDDRISYYWFYAEGFMGSPVRIDIMMRSNDGANACNVLLDVIRAVKHARDRGDPGLADIISAYGFKSPPNVMGVMEAQQEFERVFIHT